MENKELSELERILDSMMQSPSSRRAFLGALPFLMAACASAEKTRYREGDNAGQRTNLSVEDERRLTEEALKEMRKDYPPYKNSEVQSYIKSLGAKVVRENGLESNPYSYNFTVVDVPNVNAFALPAGTVFVTAPLILMSETEAELAGVVGHEVGHIVARHTAERMYAAQRAQRRSIWYGLGGAVLGGAVGVGLGRLLCSDDDRACIQKATELGVAGGAAGGLLIQKYGFMANSREDEMEADRIGFRTSYNASYSKDHVGLFYEKLLKMEEEAKRNQNRVLMSLADAMSTHPPSRERVQQMHAMQAEASRQINPVVSTRRFDQVKKIIQSDLDKRKKA